MSSDAPTRPPNGFPAFLALLLAILTGACRARASFPIDIAGVSSAQQIDALADAGFSSVEIDVLADRTVIERAARGRRITVETPEEARRYRNIRIDASRPGGFPTHAQIRLDCYMALAKGARGLRFETLRYPASPDGTLLGAPEFWQAPARVVAELRALDPYIAGSRPLPLEGIGPPLEGAAWRRGARTLAVIFNPSAGKARLPAGFFGRRWRPLFEFRRLPEENLDRGHHGEAYLGPSRVLVLEGVGQQGV